MSDSVRPHRRQPIRLLHPWDSPGKNTGVGSHFLLQCMHACMLSRFSRVRLCATLGTAAHQAPPSLGFSRQGCRSGLPFPSPFPSIATIGVTVRFTGRALGPAAGTAISSAVGAGLELPPMLSPQPLSPLRWSWTLPPGPLCGERPLSSHLKQHPRELVLVPSSHWTPCKGRDTGLTHVLVPGT